uniref:PH domain-containing protein n=1 Tax=Guillardia theta TaxID=55529 RepID=A0A7S4M161_GUITH|mmetsp:Transcript_13200/g.46243  ORF Transcript_13200/g.46243 Transcript_13200/m.46243 type:complete len:377 (+) Transcript_13200:47-1177(+)
MASPIPSRIPRPASTENFMSDREVVRLLNELHLEKIRAETRASNLQAQIEDLHKRLDTVSGYVVSDSESNADGSEYSRSVDNQIQDLEEVGSELDNFIRLRSYILHMQEGASLLLWREDGLQLCWFWLDKECKSLNWDFDEQDLGGGVEGMTGDSLLLERIIDIVPLGAGPDQLTDNPTDSSFTIIHDGGKLDIVAPTSLDFQVWYFGLAFATRLRMNAVEDVQDSSRDERDRMNEDHEIHSPSRMKRSSVQFLDTEADKNHDSPEVENLMTKMEEQRRLIEQLQRENQALKEVRRNKDEAISRLLKDLQAAENRSWENMQEGKTPATSQESDSHWHHREIYRVRQRNSKLQQILQVKQKTVREMWFLLKEMTAHS